MFVDPNADYVASLSEAELQSYYEDLYGPVFQTQVIAADEVYVSPSLLDQGCMGQARYEVGGEDPASDPEVAALLNEYYSNQSDAETEQFVRAWAECLEPALAEYGIDETPTDMYAGSQLVDIEKYLALGAEQRPFTDRADLEAIRASGAHLFSAYQVGSAPGIAYVAPPGDVPVLSGPKIDQLSEMEREIWRADQACQDDVGWLQLQRDREQALAEQIRAVQLDR
ncbi:MAG TPA: hypothetical protein VNQ73_22800 [Ilumatobacter sp.]|nr:hypothetical protein [Ilumatobacter sp.]